MGRKAYVWWGGTLPSFVHFPGTGFKSPLTG